MKDMPSFFGDLSDFRVTLSTGFQMYNSKKVGYGKDIVLKASNFLPY